MRKIFSLSFVVGLLILSLCLVPGLFPQAAKAEALPAAGDFVPGQVIVGFKDGVSLDQARAKVESVLPEINGVIKKTSDDASVQAAKVAAAEGVTVRTSAASPQAMLIELSDKSSEAVSRAIAEFQKVDGVKFAEPNGFYHIPEGEFTPSAVNPEDVGQVTADIQQAQTRELAEPKVSGAPDASAQSNTNDPLLQAQWGYFHIWANLTPAFPTSAVMVAVVDSGVDYTHPDLTGRVVKGHDYVNGDTDPMDDFGHGTHVAGIIGAKANNNIGITGVSPTSKIYAVKVLDQFGNGTWWDIGQGIDEAALHPAVWVINLSLGGYSYSSYIEQEVNFAWTWCVIVAAAGNDNIQTPLFYPAALTNCMAVAAEAYNSYTKASFSNWGSWVDIAAPGETILSTVPAALYGAAYAYISGTSMAAPFVSGAAARTWVTYPGNSNTRSRLEAREQLKPLQAYTWPATSPFGELNLFRTICPDGYLVDAYVLDGKTAQPVVGAKMTLKKTVAGVTTVLGTDIVPAGVPDFDDWWNTPSGGEVCVITRDTVYPGPFTVPFTKAYWSTVTLKNVYAGPQGIVPMIKAGAAWTVVVTWRDPSPSHDNDLLGWLPPSTPYFLYYGATGDMSYFPWARYNRDSISDNRPLESICLKKKLPGVYNFAVYNLYDSDTWLKSSGMVAWVFKGTTLKAMVPITTFGNGWWWEIGQITTISGVTKFVPINVITYSWPGPYAAAAEAEAGGKASSRPEGQAIPRDNLYPTK